jgi:hypothetical protein
MPKIERLKKLYATNWGRFAIFAVIIIAFAVIGELVIIFSHAASPFVATEPENGTVNSPAVKTADSTASGGAAVQFAAGSSGGDTDACPAYPSFPDASCTGWQHTGVTL